MTTKIGEMIPAAAAWLSRYSIDFLRISIGLVMVGFGALKLVPGMSPAEGLVVPTVEALTLGVVAGPMAMYVTAIIEVVIGAVLVSGRYLPVAVVALVGTIMGWMASLVVMFGDMFPAGGPALEAQYALKDVVFLAAALVIAAKALGARLVTAQEPTRDRSTVKLVA